MLGQGVRDAKGNVLVAITELIDLENETGKEHEHR
jgi:hypothetical protein